ncbi:TolC family protein [Campylobacter corcagiensis]|uniref:TolC family protein n=1 Tax=Campylobacter corcagiensis TaxID=1448857 RepID=A0A7M1LG70_9BACT|nr:TolC family protein [Campylobacter corcagiensis]QKF64793.1 outer membrane efflux protein, TolC family [Campylobacter corcagiensis]QOQ87044.1 TolC family protein [Campylobacter corcagiensis]
MRNFINLVFLVFILVGCAGKTAVDNYKVQEFIDENESFTINEKWYLGYDQKPLNLLIDRALVANKELEIAALNSLQALARVGLIKADLLPTFMASWGVESGRDISVSQEWKDSFSSNLSISYELDLYGKIKDSVSSSQWSAKASIYDLKAAKLNVINLVVDSYFRELYLRDTLMLLDENLKNYKSLKNIVNLKVNLGKSMPMEALEVEKSILNLQNQILNFKKDRVANLEILRNLLYLKPDETINLDGKALLDIKFMGVDMSVPVYALSNRPDIRSFISQINSSFYDYKVRQKSFYPTISLGGSLSSSSSDFSGSGELDFLSGSIRINLPFLDYNRLKANLKISELEFEKRVATYKNALYKALNEVSRFYSDYTNSLLRLENSSKISSNAAKLSSLYYTRYTLGKAELKDYLEAKNAEISAKTSLINEKYKALQSEISVYKAMAGKFESKY